MAPPPSACLALLQPAAGTQPLTLANTPGPQTEGQRVWAEPSLSGARRPQGLFSLALGSCQSGGVAPSRRGNPPPVGQGDPQSSPACS